MLRAVGTSSIGKKTSSVGNKRLQVTAGETTILVAKQINVQRSSCHNSSGPSHHLGSLFPERSWAEPWLLSGRSRKCRKTSVCKSLQSLLVTAEQMSMSLLWTGPLPNLPNCGGFFWTFRAERLMPGVRRTTDCTQKSWRILVCLHRGIARKRSARPAGSAENLSLQNSITTLGPIHETGLSRKITIRWVHDAL